MNKSEVLSILEDNGLYAKSKFGQNFLCNEEITKRIIDVSGSGPSSEVLEIGPGIGALTKPLAGLVNSVTAIEIDRDLFSFLEKSLGSDIRLILSDFLKLSKEDYTDKPFDKILSNIPYYVMTDILKKLFVECNSADKMTFMVEDDATSRIICEPQSKQYGPLAVLAGVYGKVKKEFIVPSDCFYPAPHTTSCVITITKVPSGFEITRGFCEFVEASFSKRRKTLSNSLSDYLKNREVSTGVQDALIKLGYPSNSRAEVLRPYDFVELYRLLLI